jgi:hypothetical protein
MGWVDDELIKATKDNGRFQILRNKMEMIWSCLIEFCNAMPEEIRPRVKRDYLYDNESSIEPNVDELLPGGIFFPDKWPHIYNFHGHDHEYERPSFGAYILFNPEKNSYFITAKETFNRKKIIFSEEVEEWVYYPIKTTDAERIIQNVYFRRNIANGFRRLLKEDYERF